MDKKVIPIIAGVAAVGGIAYWALRRGGAPAKHQDIIKHLGLTSGGRSLTPKLVHTGWQDMGDQKRAPMSTWVWVISDTAMHEDVEAVTDLWGEEAVSIEVAKLAGNAIQVFYDGVLKAKLPEGATDVGAYQVLWY